MKSFINLFKLTKITDTDESTIDFCKEFGLFPKEIKYPNCNDTLDKLYKMKNNSSGTRFRYQCKKRNCRKKGKKNSVNLRAQTWFNEARISLRKSLFLVYCFVYQLIKILFVIQALKKTAIGKLWSLQVKRSQTTRSIAMIFAIIWFQK